MPPTVHSIALALPEHRFPRAEAERRLGDVFRAMGEDPTLVTQIVANSGIDERRLARPPDYYLSERTLTARNRTYHEVAIELGVQAAGQALERAGVAPDEVDLVIDTSCTGIMIPALDVYVANQLGFKDSVRRMPLTEAGCAAGATSLAFGADLVRARAQTVLLLSVELPSLTLQLDDPTRANLVSAAIFGDGAAALVLKEGPPPVTSVEHLAHETVLFKDTTEIMGFELKTEGFRIVLSRRIPMLVQRELRARVEAFLAREGVAREELRFFCLHPGGTKVLDSVRDVLELSEEQVAASRSVLARHGNLSSASVHFVLHELLEQGAIAPGAVGLLVAMGPGFTLELALLRGVAPA